MAYGQGMLLDSFRNILNRRQQARAEDDQFQLAQDRGENAMERLKMQADMSVAQKQAADENAILKELIRERSAGNVANINRQGKEYGADRSVDRADVTGQGFLRSQEAKNAGMMDVATLTAAEHFRRLQEELAQRDAAQSRLFEQQDEQGNLERQNRLDVANTRGSWANRNVQDNRGQRDDPDLALLKGLEAEASKIETNLSSEQRSYENAYSGAGTRGRQARVFQQHQDYLAESEKRKAGRTRLNQLYREIQTMREKIAKRGPMPTQTGTRSVTTQSASGNQVTPVNRPKAVLLPDD